MAKKKLQRFLEIKEFENVIEPYIDYTSQEKQSFYLKGKWNKIYFKNNNPITLELACGKGEYTFNLAKLNFNKKNYIGIDIKGNRIWKGAKNSIQENLNNVAFLRTRIEFIDIFFEKNEISEIWITFPDPQIKKTKKRLTSEQFLNKYRKITKKNALIHLKTDNIDLFNFSIHSIGKKNILYYTYNLYDDIKKFSKEEAKILSIKTFYEEKFLQEGKSICYLKALL